MILRSLALLVLTLAVAQPALAQGATQPGPLKTFKDWVIGCDNLRSCLALGLSPEEDSSNAYVRVARGGAAANEPSVVFAVMAEDAPKAATLALAIDGKPLPGLAPLTVKVDGSFVTAALSPAEGRSLIAALRPAKAMTLEMHDGAKPAVTFNISLSGSQRRCCSWTISRAASAASLRWPAAARHRRARCLLCQPCRASRR